ncbi:enoyl-CoA hydratase/isomerase family protein [candidate division KSB1 bacterium]
MNRIDIQEEICVITLSNKPHNYLTNPEFIQTHELRQTINENKCKAIVISGAGRHFSAGADINHLKEMAFNASLKNEIEKGKKLLATLKSFHLPILVSVEGICFGGGLEIVLQADIKIASNKALFAFPETNYDIIPGLGGIVKLTHITGKSKALEIVLEGNIIDAQTAKDLKIIDYLNEPKTTFTAGINLAKSMVLQRPVEIIKAVVESVRNAENLEYSQALDRETELFCMLAKEAIKKNES